MAQGSRNGGRVTPSASIASKRGLLLFIVGPVLLACAVGTATLVSDAEMLTDTVPETTAGIPTRTYVQTVQVPTVSQTAPAPIFTQSYGPTEVTALSTAGNIVAPRSYSVRFLDSSTARFEVHSGDRYLSWSGERAQLQLPGTQGAEGDSWHWRFTFTLAPDFQFSSGFYTVLWESHHTGLTGSPPSTLQLHDNRIVWREVTSADPSQTMHWTETDLGPATPGVPTTVEVNARLSTDPTRARTLVTVNDVPHTISGPNLLTGMNVYPIWGLYRAASPLTQVVSFGPMVRLP